MKTHAVPDLVACIAICLMAGACAGPADAPGEPSSASRPGKVAAAQTAVALYDPERAWNGYTLTLHRARVPTLIDMNGRTVHSWPGARVKSRVRLLEDGSLLGIALGRALVEYDWEGRLTWKYDLGRDLPHHDVVRLPNGNTLFPVKRAGRKTDDVLEVDRSGAIVWEWRSGEHLDEHIDDTRKARGDITHINSVQLLPENRWHHRGDARFRPGNLLLSARNLNAIFVVDRSTGDVVWNYKTELDLQHESLMIEPGNPGAGNILLFNNGYWNRYDYRKSKIVEIDPVTKAVVWEYQSEDFYSPTGGVQQPLPNGNVLVGSTRGGRAFEITRAGDIVWQWTPPFDPVRPSRYPYDHCPQLAARGRPTEVTVVPPSGYRYISKRAYAFAQGKGMRREELDGTPQDVLAKNNDCRDLLLPTQARLKVTYGVDRDRALAAGQTGFRAEFAMSLEEEESSRVSELFRDTVGLEGVRWREQTVDLARFAHRRVRLCVITHPVDRPDGFPTEEFSFWSDPAIYQDLERDASQPAGELPHLTPEELDARREHLEALGYIN